MTEYEINLAVAKKTGHQPSLERGVVKVKEELRHGVIVHYDNFDPCNNAQQALEIMLANHICVLNVGDSYVAFNVKGKSVDRHKLDEKPFVAAMFLFLEI